MKDKLYFVEFFCNCKCINQGRLISARNLKDAKSKAKSYLCCNASLTSVKTVYIPLAGNAV